MIISGKKREIIRMRESGARFVDIAKAVGCTPVYVAEVIKRKEWYDSVHPSLKHLEGRELWLLVRNGINSRDELLAFLENHRLTELHQVGETLERRILEKMNIVPGSKC